MRYLNRKVVLVVAATAIAAAALASVTFARAQTSPLAFEVTTIKPTPPDYHPVPDRIRTLTAVAADA